MKQFFSSMGMTSSHMQTMPPQPRSSNALGSVMSFCKVPRHGGLPHLSGAGHQNCLEKLIHVKELPFQMPLDVSHGSPLDLG